MGKGPFTQQILLIALVVFCDQIFKILAPSFGLSVVKNTGGLWGIGADWNLAFLLLGAIISGILFIVVFWRSQTSQTVSIPVAAAGLIIGGALSNLIDRFLLGYVRDMINLGFWPVFNLADAAIVTGVVIIGWQIWESGKV